MKKLKSNKLSKGKKKYQLGGRYNKDLTYAEDESAQNQQIEQTGTSAVSAIPGLGPLWGALAGIGTKGSEKIIGDGSSTSRNIGGDIANPFNQFKNNKNAGEWAMSFLAPGVSSVVKGRRMKKEAAQRETSIREANQTQSMLESKMMSDTIMANYNSKGVGLKQFKSGGNLVWAAPGLSFFKNGGLDVDGGKLQPIAENGNAFEVEGNDPGKTDDVNIGNAFVDHDEVVKPVADGIQIFSATLEVPGTKKTFSQEAKKLEKQKTDQPERFPEQNNIVESKLMKLFNLQQMLNGNNTGESTEEALQPAGESPGKGFGEGDGSMFQTGGLMASANTTPRSKSTPVPVTFNTLTEHDNHYRPLALNKLEKEYPNVYQAYQEAHGAGDFETMDNLLAVSQVYPAFTAPKKSRTAGTPTDWKNLDFGKPSTGGYRYKQGLPAKGSINKGFQKGGMVKPLVADPNKIGELQSIIGKPKANSELKAWEMKNMPWTDRDRVWQGGETNLGKNLYINDAGNLERIPEMKAKNPLLMLPMTKQDNTKVRSFQKGGMAALTSDDDASMFTQASTTSTAKGGGQSAGKFAGMGAGQWGNIGNIAGAIAPGLMNLGRANKLPKPGKPRLDRAIQLSKVDYSDVNNAHNRNLALQLRMADQGSVNPNISPALKAIAFGQHGENLNKMFGETARINAQIGNQQASINQDVQGRNNLKLQGYDDALAGRRANQLGLQSQATSSIANNLNTLQRERNQQKLDLRNAEMYESYLETVAPGILDRHKQLAIERKTSAPPSSNKKGGKILTSKYRLGGSLKKKMSC